MGPPTLIGLRILCDNMEIWMELVGEEGIPLCTCNMHVRQSETLLVNLSAHSHKK